MPVGGINHVDKPTVTPLRNHQGHRQGAGERDDRFSLLHDYGSLAAADARPAAAAASTTSDGAAGRPATSAATASLPAHLPRPSPNYHGVSHPTGPSPLSLSLYHRQLQRTLIARQQLNAVAERERARAVPLSFSLAHGGLHVATLTLSRAAVRLGDTIDGAISFAGAQIPTLSLSISLDVDEHIPATGRTITTTIDERHRSTSTLLTDRFTLSVPTSAPQTMNLDRLRVEWRLRVSLAIAGTEGGPPFDGQAFQRAAVASTTVGSAIDFGAVTPLGDPTVIPLHWSTPIDVLIVGPPPDFLFEPKAIQVLSL